MSDDVLTNKGITPLSSAFDPTDSYGVKTSSYELVWGSPDSKLGKAKDAVHSLTPAGVGEGISAFVVSTEMSLAHFLSLISGFVLAFIASPNGVLKWLAEGFGKFTEAVHRWLPLDKMFWLFIIVLLLTSLVTFIREARKDNSNPFAIAHNLFLNGAFTTGVVGGIFFILANPFELINRFNGWLWELLSKAMGGFDPSVVLADGVRKTYQIVNFGDYLDADSDKLYASFFTNGYTGGLGDYISNVQPNGESTLLGFLAVIAWGILAAVFIVCGWKTIQWGFTAMVRLLFFPLLIMKVLIENKLDFSTPGGSTSFNIDEDLKKQFQAFKYEAMKTLVYMGYYYAMIVFMVVVPTLVLRMLLGLAAVGKAGFILALLIMLLGGVAVIRKLWGIQVGSTLKIGRWSVTLPGGEYALDWRKAAAEGGEMAGRLLGGTFGERTTSKAAGVASGVAAMMDEDKVVSKVSSVLPLPPKVSEVIVRPIAGVTSSALSGFVAGAASASAGTGKPKTSTRAGKNATSSKSVSQSGGERRKPTEKKVVPAHNPAPDSTHTPTAPQHAGEPSPAVQSAEKVFEGKTPTVQQPAPSIAHAPVPVEVKLQQASTPEQLIAAKNEKTGETRPADHIQAATHILSEQHPTVNTTNISKTVVQNMRGDWKIPPLDFHTTAASFYPLATQKYLQFDSCPKSVQDTLCARYGMFQEPAGVTVAQRQSMGGKRTVAEVAEPLPVTLRESKVSAARANMLGVALPQVRGNATVNNLVAFAKSNPAYRKLLKTRSQ